MLILTRKAGQAIVIGEDRKIVLKVAAIVGGKVRLGIEADASISVRRVEPETVTPAGEWVSETGESSCYGNCMPVGLKSIQS